MSENKFIKHLRGEQTAKSVLELKNQRTNTSFANMPEGTSNANEVYSDHRGNATAVLKGTDNWKLNGSSLVIPTDIYGDGRDVTGTYDVAGQTLWVNASYTFPQAKIFTPNTKWVLKLCGNRLLSGTNDTIPLTLLIKFGTTTVATKAFPIKEHAFNFSEELVVDFSESNANNIKVAANSVMTVQVLCGDATATAQIYNGMTVFTALQRRVDADVVASDEKTFDEVVDDVEQLQEDLDNLEEYVDETFVKKAGDTMTGALNIADIASSNTPLLTLTHSSTATYKWNIAPRYNSTTLSIYPGSTETNGFRFATTGFVPASNNARYLGSASLKWKGVYTAMLNNGADVAVPTYTGTMVVADYTSATAGQILGLDNDLKPVWQNAPDSLPDQTGQSGKFLTTDGTDASWGDALVNESTNATSMGIGSPVSYNQSVLVGKNAEVSANGYSAVGVGYSAKVWRYGVSVGYAAIVTKIGGIAIGALSKVTGNRAIQFNTSSWEKTNPDADTFKVANGNGNFEIMSADGTIPTDRFTTTPSTDGTYVPTLTISSGVVTRSWGSGGSSSYHPDLFDWKWADHQVNDVQWLRADTFSWQSGSVYQAAFDELFYDIQISTYWYSSGGPGYTKSRTPAVGDAVYLNSDLTTQIGTVEAYDDANDEITVSGNTYTFMSNTYVTPTTETVAGYSLSVYTGHSGRKIVSVSDETNVANIYAATGVAWYYIIDIPNKRFKLPRTKWGVTGYRDGVGNYVNQNVVLPKMAGVFSGGKTKTTYTGPFYLDSTEGSAYPSGTNSVGNVVGFDTSRLNSVYSGDGTDTLIQPRATQMYLYFYVGEFTQAAIENTAGLNAELFNDKVDVGHEVIAFQAPTAQNNYTWYRKYADGWVEQGGSEVSVAEMSTVPITLPVVMADTSYSAVAQNNTRDTSADAESTIGIEKTSTTTVTLFAHYLNPNTVTASWQISGMAA